MQPGTKTLSSPSQPTALPGFAFITLPQPERSRRRYLPVALATLVTGLLLYGVMDQNHSTRVTIARAAQADVQIDPDRLPVSLVQYPATVTGQTRDGQKVRCTIRSLHDRESPSCAVPAPRVPVPKPQVRVAVSDISTPSTGAARQSKRGRHDADVSVKLPVQVPYVRRGAQGKAGDDQQTGRPPMVVPPAKVTVPADRDATDKETGATGATSRPRVNMDLSLRPNLPMTEPEKCPIDSRWDRRDRVPSDRLRHSRPRPRCCPDLLPQVVPSDAGSRRRTGAGGP